MDKCQHFNVFVGKIEQNVDGNDCRVFYLLTFVLTDDEIFEKRESKTQP